MYTIWIVDQNSIMDGAHYDAKHSVICIQLDSDTDGYDSDVYHAE